MWEIGRFFCGANLAGNLPDLKFLTGAEKYANLKLS
jgi:hypothetical protein